MALAQLADLKAYLDIPAANTGSDALLSRLLSASSDYFETQTERTMATASYTASFDGDGARSYYPRRIPVVSVSSVSVDGTAVAKATGTSDDGWLLDGYVVRLRNTTFSTGVLNCQVCYVAGYDPIPQDVQQAVIELATLKFKERTHVGKQSEGMVGMNATFLPSITPRSVQDVIDDYSSIPGLG
jgi:hypothetical protein